MKTARSWFGLVGALVPVLFCGGLLLYLNNVRGAFGGWLDGALGPTMLGLAATGLLFLILFLLKLHRLSAPPPAKGGGMDAALAEAKSDFDPDAALARYMARRAATPLGPEDRPPPGSIGRKRG
jgi:hypothetical protein